MRLTKRTAGIIAAVAVVAGGGGAALAAGGGPFGGGDGADDLAAAINAQAGTSITPAEVEAALEQLRDERLAEAVAAGRLTQEQADQIRAGEAFRETSRTAIAEAVASALGITVDRLEEARDAGTSPAELAQERGVARTAVVAAVVDALEALRAAAPAEVADRFADEDLTARAEAIVDGTGHGGRGHGFGPGGHGGPGHGFGPGGPDGDRAPAPDDGATTPEEDTTLIG